MNFFNPNYFIHATNILLLVAYSVRDILWLRLFAVAASLIAIPYFLLQPATLWAPLSWSVVFATINLFQAFRIYIDRRPVKLTRRRFIGFSMISLLGNCCRFLKSDTGPLWTPDSH